MDRASPSLIGQTIGGYLIEKALGEGGMGTVYLGVHQQIGRRSAIKVLHPELSRSPDIAARFLNEARAANRVQHPGIVGIFEFGQREDGVTFIVMEHLPGEPLGRRLRRQGGRLEVQEVLRLARQIASALCAAHEQAVVHRDLKPDNVMVVPDAETPGGERAKLLDFGIAKVQAASGSLNQTRAGVLMGTPIYMAPEQCRGAAAVNDRADVYALGVMIYEMLAGRPPFQTEALGDIIALHLFTPPPPLGPLCPGAPAGLVTLVQRMLEKSPAARPAMAAVKQELERLGAPGGSLPPQQTIALPEEPRRTTTLGEAAGALPVTPRGGGSLARTLTLCALLLCGAGLGAAHLYGEIRRQEQAAATLAPPPPQRVRWSIGSDPQGADVVLDGQVIGQTPWVHHRVRREGSVRIVLRSEGHKDVTLDLDGAADAARSERLPPAPPPAPAVAPSPPAAPASPAAPAIRPPTPIKGARPDRRKSRPETSKQKVRSDDDIPILD